MSEKQKLVDSIEAKRQQYIDAADRIWETPETRFATDKSVEVYYEILEKEGFTIEKGIADMKNAFVATYGSGNPVIGILAEYDALDNLSQIADDDQQEPLIKGANGHGCGHNLLGTGALAGAVGVKDYLLENKVPGTIKLFGCPAEESGYGKAFMTRDGIFDGLDAALAWHPMDVSMPWSLSSLAVNQVYYHFKGKAAHAAAAPEMGRSALDAAELMNTGVQYLREHIIDEARVHYAFIDAGGTSANVVQPTATLYYFIRAPKLDQVSEIYQRVNKIAKGAAMMTETEVEIEFDSACADYIPNHAVTTAMYENLKNFGDLGLTEEDMAYGKRYFDKLPEEIQASTIKRNQQFYPQLSKDALEKLNHQPYNTEVGPLVFSTETSGSTDVGDVSWTIPTAQVLIGCEIQGTPPHSWQWVANGKSDIAHKGLLSAGKVIATTALDLLTQPELLAEAKKEHETFLNGQNFVSGIPTDVKPR